MEIDGKLLKFESEVGSRIGEVEKFKNELSSDMEKLILINNNMVSQLNTAFQSEGGVSTVAQMEYVNQTVTKIKASLESELGVTITDCKTLNAGIGELHQIISSHASKTSELSGLEADDPRRGSLRSEIASLERDFASKHSDLCTKHDVLLGKDSGTVVLDQFSQAPPTVNINPTLGTAATDLTTSIYYEVNGVIYQKVLPYSLPNGGVGASYTIAYDKNAIINAVGSDSEMGQKAIQFLNSKLKGNKGGSALWKMFGKSYTGKECSDIGKIMDVILEGSYKSNNCKSVSDYATIAAVVATNSLVYLRGSGSGVAYTKGFQKVVRNGYNCIEFTAWTYYQGLAQVYKLGDNADVGLKGVTIMELSQNGTDIRKMSSEELLQNLKPGTIITRYGYGSGHTGTVLGVLKNEAGKYEVKIAQAKPSSGGIEVSRWPLKSLTNDWSKILTTDMMTKRAVEGSCK